MITKKVKLKYNMMICYQTQKVAGAQPEISQDRFSEIKALDKHFVKNTRNIFEFSPRYSYNYILNCKFNLKMDTVRVFFPKNQGFFSRFSKKGRGTSEFLTTYF